MQLRDEDARGVKKCNYQIFLVLDWVEDSLLDSLWKAIRYEKQTGMEGNLVWKANRYEKQSGIWKVIRYEKQTGMKSNPVWKAIRYEKQSNMKSNPVWKAMRYSKAIQYSVGP